MSVDSIIRVPALVSAEEFLKHEYDYVICGGGTAGLVIATRLAERRDVKVGVIEAGKSKLGDPAIDTPAMCLSLVSNPEYDWLYKTVPQEHHNNIVHHVPRGKLLGGSSAINYMVYVRGQSSEYDDWAEIVGDDGWSANNMMHYMRKHQSLEPLSKEIKDKTSYPFIASNHGTEGPIKTSFSESVSPLDEALLAAAEEVAANVSKPTDPWGGDHLGFYHGLASIKRTGPNRGKRSYAAGDYFLPMSSQSNLKVVTESTVARVVLEGSAATGVEFINSGVRRLVKAKQEVVVCGGVIASPQMLELSGIGDPNVLEKAGVKCLVDLPSVGQDLQDHLMGFLSTQLAPGVHSGDSMRFPEVFSAVQKQYTESGSGPLAEGATTCGYLPASTILEPAEMAEVVRLLQQGPHESEFQAKQMQQTARQIQSDKSANLYFSYIPKTVDITPATVGDQGTALTRMIGPEEPDAIVLNCSLQFCGSRGWTHIQSSDPFAHPALNPRYSSNEADTILRAAGLRFLDKLVRADKVKAMIGKRTEPPENIDLASIEESRKAAKETILGQYHLCGSCAMGHTVDSKLRVKGVKNLRVADASVFPGNVSGNIQGTVYAVAEKAADLIKADFK